MKKRLAYGLLTASLLITGCQSTGTKDSATTDVSITFADAEKMLSIASTLQGEAQQQQILAAAELYLSLGDNTRALSTSGLLASDQLGDALYAKQIQIQSQALYKQQNIYASKGLLESNRLVNILINWPIGVEPSDPSLKLSNSVAPVKELRELRASVYSEIGEPQLVIRERISLSKLFGANNKTSIDTLNTINTLNTIDDKNPDNENISDALINQELIWMTLMDLSIEQLSNFKQEALDTDETGWYELAIVSKNNQRNINQQYMALIKWQEQWPNHLANNPLPADLSLIEEIINNQPKRIALLLPLSGDLAPIAKAIRDGFMAAYYTNKDAGSQIPDLKIYDISRGDINENYDFAVSQGAEVIVGPLSKDHINELALRVELPVPTLALNTVEASAAYPQNIFQLGLGIEDEADQTAERAFQDGKRTALIFAPASTQGDRASQIFNEKWQQLGGTVVDNIRYASEPNLSKTIEHVMHVDDSKKRAQELQSIVGHLEFEPRRRQDIDMVFLIAQPRQGRQIKPLFAFHYAGDIPIYSTSSIFEGGAISKEPDLNGITFSNLPWFFQKSPEKSLILSNKTMNARSQRLYALGIDAFYLYPRLEQLNAAKRANFWGQTGVLSLSEHRQFIRKQQWAKFSRGKVKPLTSQYDQDLQ